MNELRSIIMMGTVEIQNEMLKKIKRAQATRQRRQDPVLREKERMRNLIATRLRRQDPEVRAKERERNRMAMRLRRQNPEFKAKERHAMVMRKLNLDIPVEPNVQVQYPLEVEYKSHIHHLTTEMQEQMLINMQDVNRALPLQLEMRVDEEDVDDPDEVESKGSEDFDESQEEMMPVPVEVTITPYGEEFKVEEEEGELQEEGHSQESTTLHEEVDIKEEETDNTEEELQPLLEVNIKEEPREDDEELGNETSLTNFETSSNYNKDAHEEQTTSSFSSVIVDGGEDQDSEEEILPHAAMVVVPGHGNDYPEGFVEENVVVKPPIRTYKRSKVSSKRVDTVYRCPNCSLCYTSPEYLAGHVRRGCRYRPSPIKNAYLCIVCGDGFNNYGDLYQHKRQKHAKSHSTGGPISATSLPKSQAAGENSKDFQCPNCPRTFSAPGYLVQHLRSHIRQRTDFSCDLCGEGFRQKPRKVIEAHFKEKHSSKEMLGCSHCFRIYGLRQNLVTHLQTHGEFECFVCNVQFSCQQLLTEHFRSHSPDNQPFKCGICHKTYWQQGRFFEHRRKTHNIIEKPSHRLTVLRNEGQRSPSHTNEKEENDDDDDDEVQVISIINQSKK